MPKPWLLTTSSYPANRDDQGDGFKMSGGLSLPPMTPISISLPNLATRVVD